MVSLVTLNSYRKWVYREIMRPLAREALEAIQTQGGKVVNFDLIEPTLKEINQSYTPGLVEWVKVNRPDIWTEIRRTEETINRTALSWDRAILEDALSNYRGFFSEMMKVYGKGETLPLFRVTI